MEHIGIDIELLLEQAEFDKNVDALNKKIKTLKKEVKAVNKELKLDPKNVELLNQKFKNLEAQEKLATKVLNEYKRNLENLAKENKYGTDEWNATIVAIEKAQSDLHGIQKQLENCKNLINDQENGWLKVADNIEGASKSLSKVADTLEPISREASEFLGGAIDGAIEFESAFADVEKTVNASDDVLAEIRLDLRELAKELPTTASELSKIAGLAGQMNVPAEQIKDFTKAIVDFANSTNIEAESAVQDIAQIYNVIGKGGNFDDLDQLLSTIVELGNNTATTEKDLVEMFRNVAAGASRVGMTEAQMAALSATLSSLGLDKGGASAISKLLTRIDMAVTENGETLALWAETANMSAEEFSKAWGKDSAGALLAVVQGMANASEEGDSLNQVLMDLDVTELRQVDTLSRLVNAHGEYEKNIDLANEAYSKGTALSEEAEKRYRTVAAQIQILKNNFMEFALAIGDILLPYIRFFVQSVKDLSDWLNNLSPHTKQLIARMLTIVAVSAPLLRTMANLGSKVAIVVRAVSNFKGILTMLMSPLANVLTTFVKIATTLGKFLLFHPGLLSAIVLLTTIVGVLYETCEPFRQFVDNLIQKMKDLWAQFKQTNWIERLGEKFGWFGEIIGGLIELVKTLFGWFGRLIEKALEFLGIKQSIEDTSGELSKGYISNGGAWVGGNGSGGFASGGFTLNASFNVNTSSVTRSDVRSWANWLADDINEQLGKKIR